MSHTLLTGVPIVGTVRDQSYLDTYVNQIRLSANLSDISLVFGVVEDIGPNQLVNKDRVTIRMTMATAKALMQHLEAAVGGYEAAVAPIPMPFGSAEGVAALKSGVEETLGNMLRSPSEKSSAT
jgi:hypothetical protein